MVILGAAELKSGVTQPSGPVGCGGSVVGIVEVGVEDCVLEADLYSKPGGGGQSLPPVNVAGMSASSCEVRMRAVAG